MEEFTQDEKMAILMHLALTCQEKHITPDSNFWRKVNRVLNISSDREFGELIARGRQVRDMNNIASILTQMLTSSYMNNNKGQIYNELIKEIN